MSKLTLTLLLAGLRSSAATDRKCHLGLSIGLLTTWGWGELSSFPPPSLWLHDSCVIEIYMFNDQSLVGLN